GRGNPPVIMNVPQGRIKIAKFALWALRPEDGQGGNTNVQIPLTGAKFEIYKKSSDTSTFAADSTGGQSSVNFVQELTITNTDGTILSKYLAPGKYWVKETAAPNGNYVLFPDAKVVEVESNKDKEVEFDNTPLKSRIQIYKRERGTEILLNRADFELYIEADDGVNMDVNGVTKKLKQVKTGNIQSGTYDDPSTVEDDDGMALTVELDPNVTYYLKELNTSELITNDGYRYEVQWTIIPATSMKGGEITPVTVYNYKPTSAPGIKTDGMGGVLKDVHIALFAQKSDADNFFTRLATDGVTLPLTADKLTATFKAKYGIVAVAVSQADGTFNFGQLVTSTTYYALEIIGVAGYVMDDTVHTVTVKADGTIAEGTITIVNDPYGYIRVRKIAEMSGVTYDLNGAEFKIYKAKEEPAGSGTWVKDGEAVATGYSGTDSDGYYKSIALAPGKYIVAETAPPNENFEIDTTERVVDVEAGKSNTYCVTNPFVNVSKYGRFIMVKVSSKNDATKLNATFTLQKHNGTEFVDYKPDGTNVYTFTTDKTKAYYQSELLPEGTYRVVETWVENGYTITTVASGDIIIEKNKVTNAAGPQAGDISGAPNPIKIKNDPQGSLKLKKVGTFTPDGTKTALQGVEFTLYKKVTGVATTDCVKANEVQVKTTSATGEIEFTNLDAGDYWLKETNMPSTLPYEITFVPTLVTIAVPNTPNGTPHKTYFDTPISNNSTQGKFKVAKVDKINTSTLLTGATFTIHKNADATDQSIGVMTANGDGTYTSPLLNAGTYYLKETKYPDKYMSEDGIVAKQQIAGPFTVVKNEIKDYTASSPIKNARKQKVSVFKHYLDGATQVPVGGAIFTLYADKNDAIDMTKSLGTATSSAKDGMAVFNNLLPNTTYWLIETTTPIGYKVDKTPFSFTTDNTGKIQVDRPNIPLGQIRIMKEAVWDGNQNEALSGVTFEIFNWSGDVATGVGTRGTTTGKFITTSIGGGPDGLDAGEGLSGYLEAGKYELVETFPTGYGKDPDYVAKAYAVELTEGQKLEETFYTTPIKNFASYGRFHLLKYTTGTTTGDSLTGAVFELYKKNGSGEYVYNDVNNKSFEVTDIGGYTSGALPAGDYKIKEIKAPLNHTLSSVELEFTIAGGGVTKQLTYHNDMQGEIYVEKRGDARHNNELLQDVEFTLYKGNEATAGNEVNVEGVENPTKTGSDGIASWKYLDAGIYTIKETGAADGYGLSAAPQTITLQPGESRKTNPVEFVNNANKGRIVVRKEDNQGGSLAGAEFDVYTIGGQKVNTSKITTDGTGYGFSELLPAAQGTGTKYFVVETKAPNGYTLDERVNPIKQEVMVYPFHDPANTENLVVFVNTKTTELKGFATTINKGIVKDSTTDSLLMKPFTTDFTLRDYAKGDNTIPMDTFAVTDAAINMYYYEG
ncbi:hypothetical protein LJB83_02770, partial [Clostridia bacterium OttesenSCG-928-F22]|nr:hypothetical protein [Clostridia bacterium OttesenSCG-928-F22]